MQRLRAIDFQRLQVVDESIRSEAAAAAELAPPLLIMKRSDPNR